LKIKPDVGTGIVAAAGDVYGVATSKAAVFITCHGDGRSGWVARSEYSRGTRFRPLRRFPAAGAAPIKAPAGVTISPRGEVVIGQMGEAGPQRDSRLSFFNANTGKQLLDLETGLYDVAALAYSRMGNLYALDIAWSDEKAGGLFRLDAARESNAPSIRAVQIAPLERPTAMAFAPDGTLYVTLLGVAEEKPGENSGKLMKFPSGL
jgi:hypothetical protein